jgi:2-polyprenyl-3-methyl-5-hydroxy-6-metoxy-1,4-benzoquinol methylase
MTERMEDQPVLLQHPQAEVRIHQEGARRRIVVEPRVPLFIHTLTCSTTYSVELIEHVLAVKGPGYLCDEIRRDEDPAYVQSYLEWDILSYIAAEDFHGKRVLDFGSGCGSSTMVLARTVSPSAQIVGVELLPEFIDLARHRARFHGVEHRVQFLQSPSPLSLPKNLGEFDYVVLSAVFEHLLPAERQTVLPLIWSVLKPGGILFLDQTPYRWWPVEDHTTKLPFINYLPDSLTRWAALRFCKALSPGDSWDELLRKGIRGGTPSEILNILNRTGHGAESLAPRRNSVRDHIELWYQTSAPVGKVRAKKIMKRALQAIKPITGGDLLPDVTLAIQKSALNRN